MPRQPRCRCIYGYPDYWSFSPDDGGSSGEVVLGLDEYETVRRIDHENLRQEQCAGRMEVYRSRYWTGKKPVVLVVHGGGWVYGSKEVYQYYGMDFVRRGFAVVNYSYRLAPEHRIPASLEDTLLVADFVMKKADRYGFDTDDEYKGRFF